MATRTKRTKAVAFVLRLDPDRLAAVRAIAEARGESLTAWLRRAVRTQIYIDAAGPDSDTALRLIRQGTAPATQAATLAADAAQAACLLLHDLLTAQLEAAGLPRELAVQQADARVEAAWDGLSTLRPGGSVRLPAWLTGTPADSEED